MKPIRLHELLGVIGVNPKAYPNTLIKRVRDEIRRIGDRTVVFHLKKTQELDVQRLKEFRSCYIVTDQAFLKKQGIPHEQFIYVTNVEQAYLSFIRYYRSLFNIPVVAVTGTCGKTTTKEMIKQALSKDYRVVGTIRSKNNLRFNHQYLMEIDDDTQFAVFETAMTHPGNLITESEFFRPTIGVITTIGFDHLNHMKTMDNYARAKGEMLAALNYEGTLILNNDDERIRDIDLTPYRGKVITFGTKEEADFRGTDLQFGEHGMRFTLVHRGNQYPAYIPGLGEHQVYNALAALAVLNQLGMDLKKAIGYLSVFQPVKSHTAIIEGIRGSTIIDDTWSSNPTSMKAALNVLKERGKGKVKIAVIGKIAYLGDHEQVAYRQIGKMLVDNGIDYVITADQKARDIGEHAVRYGLPKNRFIPSNSQKELLRILRSMLNEQTVVLMKVSMLEPGFDKVIEQIKA